MAPKKGAQAGGQTKKAGKKMKLVDPNTPVNMDVIPCAGVAWRHSRLSEGDLEVMEASGLIPPRVMSEWRSAVGQGIPFETRPDEVLVFALFFERGMGLPLHPFVVDLLQFYGLHPIHINPNSCSMISTFIHWCEAFAGIQPHFNFFRHLHRVQHQPSSANPSLVGGAGFQYQYNHADEFFKANYNDSNKDWKQDWFFMKNLGNTIGERPVRRPAQRICWNAKLSDEELHDIEELKL